MRYCYKRNLFTKCILVKLLARINAVCDKGYKVVEWLHFLYFETVPWKGYLIFSEFQFVGIIDQGPHQFQQIRIPRLVDRNVGWVEKIVQQLVAFFWTSSAVIYSSIDAWTFNLLATDFSSFTTTFLSKNSWYSGISCSSCCVSKWTTQLDGWYRNVGIQAFFKGIFVSL
jgi:hypothetical protein